MKSLHAIGVRESPPAAAKPRAHTVLARPDPASGCALSHKTASVDPPDTEPSAMEDRGEIESDREPDRHAPKAGPDPLQDMVLWAVPHQAQAVQEASAMGAVRLGQALARGDAAEVRTVLRLAPYLLNNRLPNGETPLQMAVARGNPKMVALLLQRDGIDPNRPGADGWTPLCLAAHKNETEIAAQLILHGQTRVNDALPNGSSPFYIAVAHNHPGMAQRLLRAGAAIHQTKRGGFAPFHAACHAGHVDMVRWLLKRPQLWQQGGTGTRTGKTRDRQEVLNPRTASGQTPLMLASNKGRLGVVRLLLEQQGTDPNLVDDSRYGALHRAAARGHTEVLARLLEHPLTEVNPRGPPDVPALFSAMALNQLHTAAMLLDHGADIHWRTEEGTSILDVCVRADEGTAQWLFQRPELLRRHGRPVRLKALLNQAGSDGVTVLQQAASEGNAKLVQRLLSHGADPHQEDAHGGTALQNAVEQGDLETVQLLFALRKTGIDRPLPTGDTLFCVAIEAGNMAVAQWLLDQGADIQQPNQDGATPLHVACDTRPLAARWLLKKMQRMSGPARAAALNARNARGETALQRAARADAAETVRLLLKQQGIDPNAADTLGWTPLLEAARQGAKDALLALLAHPDIDLFQKGPDGKRLLHCAAMGSQPLPLIEAIEAQLPTHRFQALRLRRDGFRCLPVSTAAEHGASEAVIERLSAPVLPPASPVLQTHTSFQRGWILEGFDLDARDMLVDQGAKAGIQMQAVGDGDDGEALTFRKLQRLNIQPGDFVIVFAHTHWNADLKRLEMDLNKDTSVPLVEVARLLYGKGVLKALFLGCMANMAMPVLRNLLARDPMMWRPQKGPTALEDLDYTIVGRKALTPTDLNTRAAALWMEDCAARRPHALAMDSALFNRSVQPMRSVGWDAEAAALTSSNRPALNADELGHLPPAEARIAKAELLLFEAHAGRLKAAKALLDRHGVDPNVRSANGFTPLILACGVDRTAIVQHLLKQGADVHLTDCLGRSALWHACSRGCVDTVKALIAAGADPHTKDTEDRSAWDLARTRGRTAILKLLPPPPTPSI